jgi:hypothetical protein
MPFSTREYSESQKGGGPFMNVTSAASDKTILVIGSPRSGTTWLGKLLDSSPDVLYRHEPDMLIQHALPRIASGVPTPEECIQVRASLQAMVAARCFKSSGKIPIFRKAYRSPPAGILHASAIIGLHVAQKAAGDTRRLTHIPAPDLVASHAADHMTVVMKSISSLGRAKWLTASLPGMRVLLVLRDPFGQIASTLRGMVLGKFERPALLHECLQTPGAARYGLDHAMFDRLPQVEQLAWHWVLMNEKALCDLQGNDDAMLVFYNDLVCNPRTWCDAIFAFCGLTVTKQTSQFIHASTTSHRPDRYYQVYKRSTNSLSKWRHQLTTEEQGMIRGVVSRSQLWARHPALRALPTV